MDAFIKAAEVKFNRAFLRNKSSFDCDELEKSRGRQISRFGRIWDQANRFDWPLDFRVRRVLAVFWFRV